MADEDLELELEDNDAVEKRIKDLSKKVKLTAEERDEKQHLLETKDAELATIGKERDFYASFSDSVSKYPNASEYKDAIKDKVMAGYTVEDATVAVLAKEGKFAGTPTPPPPKENPAGGSSDINIGASEKTIDKMSQEERRAAIAEALGDRSLTQ